MLLKTEHIYLFKTKKTIQNNAIILKYKVYSSLQIGSEFSMIGVPDFIDKTWGMTRPSVSTSSGSIHSNSWKWNAHSSSFCRRAAKRCGLRHGGKTVSADCLLGDSDGISDGVVFCFLCFCLCKNASLIDARYNPHLEHNRLPIVLSSRTAVDVGYALWKILRSSNTKLSFQS